ncbi:hypothetical protein GWL_39150 [Herbaspirillum sp. GW103]|nr:hypothetical protein GWL_39150 [Herbaspirillum sp. GW103]
MIVMKRKKLSFSCDGEWPDDHPNRFAKARCRPDAHMT